MATMIGKGLEAECNEAFELWPEDVFTPRQVADTAIDSMLDSLVDTYESRNVLACHPIGQLITYSEACKRAVTAAEFQEWPLVCYWLRLARKALAWTPGLSDIGYAARYSRISWLIGDYAAMS